MKQVPGTRLQKVLAAAGVASRRKAEELIAAGRVSVNGKIVRELGTRIDATRDRVRVAGRIIEPEARLYLFMHKPDGLVCSGDGNVDEQGRKTVLSLLRGVRARVFPIGKLDFHTRGALLLTNDGALAAALTHPRCRVLQLYHAKFQGRVNADELEALRRGVELDDGTVTLPAEEVLVVKATSTNTWVQLGLRQGLHRQVRRMGDAIRHPVLKLIRVAIADLGIERFPEGEVRRLTEPELLRLREAAGISAVGDGETRKKRPPQTKPATKRNPRGPKPRRSSLARTRREG
jgi:23S rRNA pseudouridine2605 synthase